MRNKHPERRLPLLLGNTARRTLLTLATGLRGLELSHHKFLSSRNPALGKAGNTKERECSMNIFPT